MDYRPLATARGRKAASLNSATPNSLRAAGAATATTAPIAPGAAASRRRAAQRGAWRRAFAQGVLPYAKVAPGRAAIGALCDGASGHGRSGDGAAPRRGAAA